MTAAANSFKITLKGNGTFECNYWLLEGWLGHPDGQPELHESKRREPLRVSISHPLHPYSVPFICLYSARFVNWPLPFISFLQRRKKPWQRKTCPRRLAPLQSLEDAEIAERFT
jgi:hypothetical protein